METESVILLLFKISSNDVNKTEEHLKQAKNLIYSFFPFFFGQIPPSLEQSFGARAISRQITCT